MPGHSDKERMGKTSVDIRAWSIRIGLPKKLKEIFTTSSQFDLSSLSVPPNEQETVLSAILKHNASQINEEYDAEEERKAMVGEKSGARRRRGSTSFGRLAMRTGRYKGRSWEIPALPWCPLSLPLGVNVVGLDGPVRRLVYPDPFARNRTICLPGSAPPSSTTTTASGGGATPPANPNANYWFSFGDSYTQTGFEITGTLPTAGNPLGNPPYPGYTATGGPNWVGYEATTYNKSLLLTYNFAYGGATIDANLVKPYDPSVRSLTDQVNTYLSWNSGAGKGVWKSANTLFSIWIGINDIGNSYYSSGDRSAFSDTLLKAEFALVQKLMVPQGTSATTLEGSVINTFNSKLASQVSSFKANHTGVTTYIYDSYASFAKILDNPTAYGFRDNSTYGSGSDIFWGNNYHPSQYAHKYFAQDVAKLLASTIF
ncbi:hypothetical protein V5O48_015450 [Marasmius crinis-equi]|uniref:Carbohydrate esterase family 16 protein n=1 Tax=Marasmius crinis-equi TaxID=585013 RepID=A0ABR3EUH4_9AGAR